MPETVPSAVHPAASETGPEVPHPPGRRVFSRLVMVLIFLLLAGGAYLLYQRRATKDVNNVTAQGPPSSLPVPIATAQKGDIGVYINALGSVLPVNTVTVNSRVQGQIMSVSYHEGQAVKKGDPLIEVDPRPYQAQLDQLEGQLAHDQAVLNEARIDLERYQSALARNAVAKQQVDDQQQLVLQSEGTVKNDEGQLDNAKVNLSYCHITSPIDGVVGLRLVDLGNMVQANSTTSLLVITQVEPITVVFSVAEDYLPQIQQQLRQGHSMQVDALDRTQQNKIATGSLLTLDNQIDPTTGTIKLRALFPNTDRALFPNQFVNARLLVNTQHGVTLVPTATIQRNAQSAFVYLVKPDMTATVRPVTVGTTDGNFSAVEGIQPGDEIVLSGFDKLQEGVKVAPIKAPGNAGAGSNKGQKS